MKKLFAVMIVSGALAGAEASAQEHKHVEQKEESKMPVEKKTDAVNAEVMKCCEGMEKMGEMKAGMPMKSEMKGDMKAKMETMKATQKKLGEKMSDKGVKTQTQESKDEKIQSTQDAHHH